MAKRGLDLDALFTLVLSIIMGFMTLGLTHAWIFYRIYRTAKNTPIYVKKAEAIAVPGHQLVNGKISWDYQSRLEKAFTLFSLSDEPDIFIIGGRHQGGVSEASAGQGYLVGKGIPVSLIHKEEESNNTLENLRNARSWLESCSEVVLVTNRYHLERINALADGLGLSVSLCAAESGCELREVIRKMFNETMFLHWYWTGRYFARLTGNRRMTRKIS